MRNLFDILHINSVRSIARSPPPHSERHLKRFRTTQEHGVVHSPVDTLLASAVRQQSQYTLLLFCTYASYTYVPGWGTNRTVRLCAIRPPLPSLT